VQKIKGTNRLKINAGAGCSKTTTLSMVAHATEAKSLYLAFNKAMVEEAKHKFPHWVTVKTTHGLAYSVYGKELQHKLKRPVGRYVNVCGTGSEIARHFSIRGIELPSGKWITASGIGVSVKETVNRFEYSADKKISRKHVSYSAVGNLINDMTFNKNEYEALVVSYAEILWKQRIDPRSPILAMHDTYLKLYQLSEPDLSMYDVVYLDEAQDTNDCVLDIVSKLKKKVVLVGDPYQQIYGWRGSVNAMSKVDCEETTLSTSFRFGQAVAEIANVILNCNEPATLTLKGWDKLVSEIHKYLPEGVETHARLYRTNAALIADGVDFIVQGKNVSMEIDVRDFVKTLESALALFEGRKNDVKHENIVPFAEWSDLTAEAQFVGGELARIAAMVGKGEAYRVMQVLADYKKPLNPDIILTTAHKSKGREFDVVVLADDFPSCWNNDGEWVGLTEMERNLLYVAATRAKQLLVINSTVEEIVERARQKGGLELRVKKIYVGVDEVSLANMIQEAEDDLVSMSDADPHFEDTLQMAYEDGMEPEQVPTRLLLMPELGKCSAVPAVDYCGSAEKLVREGMAGFGVFPSEVEDFAVGPMADFTIDGYKIEEDV
jgi:superfamily I DNA/RNA helicase